MVYSLKSNSISIVIANTKYYIFTRQMEEKGACLSLFDLDNVRTSFATTVKKRDHGLHIYIILIVVVFNVTLLALQVMICSVTKCAQIIFQTSFQGQHSVTYLFLRKELDWNTETYATYIALYGFIGELHE